MIRGKLYDDSKDNVENITIHCKQGKKLLVYRSQHGKYFLVNQNQNVIISKAEWEKIFNAKEGEKV